MKLHHYESDHRIYLSQVLDRDALKSSVYQNGVENKGAGIRYYQGFAGKIMAFLGLAAKVNIDGKNYYLNNKSFTKMILRLNELVPQSNAQETAHKLNDLYILHKNKKFGYDKQQFKRVHEAIKTSVKEIQSDDFPAVVTDLCNLADKSHHIIRT